MPGSGSSLTIQVKDWAKGLGFDLGTCLPCCFLAGHGKKIGWLGGAPVHVAFRLQPKCSSRSGSLKRVAASKLRYNHVSLAQLIFVFLALAVQGTSSPEVRTCVSSVLLH